MNEPTYGAYDIEKVDGINELRERMDTAESVRDWSFILDDYVTWGNRKIADTIGIFNLNAATDCPNAETDNCQVDFGQCYAHVSENTYSQTLAYRRRQEYLWDSLDANTFAHALLEKVSRRRKDTIAMRFSQSGDFRCRGDIIKVSRIADILSENGIYTYTYSASDYLEWEVQSDTLTVNQSNNRSNFGERLYTMVEGPEKIPENGVWCPHDRQKTVGNADNAEEAIQCGECLICVTPDDPRDVYITPH